VNVIRKTMPEQVKALRALLAAYQRVLDYQFQRTDEAEARMRTAISGVMPYLRPFRRLLPRHKQNYLRALEEASADPGVLSPEDLLLLFDETVFLLHVRLSPRERGEAPPLEPWGDALLDLLDERRAWRHS
jgi:hypothetical protein